MSRAVIQHDPQPGNDGREEQIQISIAIHVRQGSSGAIKPGQLQPGLPRDVLESPATQVAEERTAAPHRGQEHVTPAVPIHVAGGDAGAVEVYLVRQVTVFRD